MTKKVVLCTPALDSPIEAYFASMKASLPLFEEAGWEHAYAAQKACPYISAARANMLRSALDAKADVVVFIDYDVAWRPGDLLKLIETEGDVVAGTYRCKTEDGPTAEFYMGTWETNADFTPKVRPSDGAISAKLVPAGFLKVTKEAVDSFMVAYSDLCYGPMYHLSVDLFNHGVRDRVWWGEDYAFSRRWKDRCGDIWLVPDLGIDHHTKDKIYHGNLHQFLMRQPGGSLYDERADQSNAAG